MGTHPYGWGAHSAYKGKSLAQGELISPEHFNIPGLPRGLPRGNGMTDPFAIEQFSRLFIPTAWSVK